MYALLFSLLFACGGDDPVAISSPVGITMKAEGGDVDGGAIGIDKSINTESGNPWAVFISDTEAALGGPPSEIEISSLEILLAASSEAVTEQNQVFDGTLDVHFELNDTDTVIPAGTGTIDDSVEGRSVFLQSEFDYARIPDAELDGFLNGSFKVVLSGVADPGFADLGAKADLVVTLEFKAYE
jgi:hypothetical protein